MQQNAGETERRKQLMAMSKQLDNSIKKYLSKTAMNPIPTTKTSNKNLIISTGDISDVDGFVALAKYATSGADVLFIMNYPQYLKDGLGSDEVLNDYGLGYSYSVESFFQESNKKLESIEQLKPSYQSYKSLYDKVANPLNIQNVKQFFTNLGFEMARRVWDETPSSGGVTKGRLFFCVGGVNDINPFSRPALKNEMFVYHDIGAKMISLETCREMRVFESYGGGNRLEKVLNEPEKIYIDFNGSMAFFNSKWKSLLNERAVKIQGVFVMGGVLSYASPTTQPSIRDVLNRLSCSTMNQLYSPQKTFDFLVLMESWHIPIFMISNNSVGEFGTNEEFETFLRINHVFSESLKKMAFSFYNSPYKPQRKPFDFYTALALVGFMNGTGKMMGSRCNLCIDPIYGATLITNKNNSKDTLAEYSLKFGDTFIYIKDPAKEENDPGITYDTEFSANTKKNFECERTLFSFLNCRMIKNVKNVEFNVLNHETALSIKKPP